jgi:hypothetical protein
MPRYYFDLRQGDQVTLDEEGLELSSLERVQEEAARSLADFTRDNVQRAVDGGGDSVAIDVRDDDGPLRRAWRPAIRARLEKGEGN